jgi:uncharacterized protein YkwD
MTGARGPFFLAFQAADEGSEGRPRAMRKPRSARSIVSSRIAHVIVAACVVGVAVIVGIIVSVARPGSPSAGTSNASCRDIGRLPTSPDSVRAEVATLCLINVQRARHDLRTLRPNADLARSAGGHSQDMVSENYFNHVSPAGETPLARIKASTYLPHRSTYLVGENIAVGVLQLATPAAIVAAWMRSRDHRANILNPDFRDSGIGIVAQAPRRYSSGQHGATYTQQFGAIAR